MSVGLVTGRSYTRTRVRGYAPWNPKSAALEIADRVRDIIAEYRQPLTVRQIFYRLVSRHGYEKTEPAYDRLGPILNRARRAGRLDPDAFRDDGDIVPPLPGWSSPEGFWRYCAALAQLYFRRPDHHSYVEIWLETAGMVPQVQAVADPFGVRAIGSGGFSSFTARRNAALRLREMAKAGPVVVVLIGDYDPSGQSIIDSTCEDVLGLGGVAEFHHLAVTPEQAEQYRLESAPQKEHDKRGEYMAATYQAEALDPDVLAEIVRAKLLELIGEDNLALAEQLTPDERRRILAGIARLTRAEKKRGG